jgi:hypothetical protein
VWEYELMRALRERPEPWDDEPGPRDLAAALEYLCLIFEPRLAERLTDALAAVETIRVHRAADLLRASGAKPLRRKDLAVRIELNKIDRGQRLAPVLLVRDITRHVLIVADGFARICASRLVNEDAVIPCRIITTS